jgi:hypothetical protein
MKSKNILAGIALAFASSSYASIVSVSAEFTSFSWSSYDTNVTYANPFAVNGIQITSPAPVALPSNTSSVTLTQGALTPGAFSFVGNTSNVAGVGPANQFILGSFSFTNGIFPGPAIIGFSLTTHSTDVALDGHQFFGSIVMDVANNIGTPEQQADFFTVQNASGSTLTSLGAVKVYEYGVCPATWVTPDCNVGTIDILGHINSLHLDAFVNPSAGAFLQALAPAPQPPGVVSEAPVDALMLLGLTIAAGTSLRKKRKDHVNRNS